MDTGLAVRPTPSVALTSNAQPDPALAHQTVATELAPSQSVTAAAQTTHARNDTARNDGVSAAPGASPVAHDVHVDPATHELVYQVVNVLSGQVISQVPDPTTLQMAAYARAIQQAEQKGATAMEAAAKADLDMQV